MGGSKTAILAQVVHFYSDGVDHITIGGDKIARSLEMTIYAGAINREHVHMLIGIPPHLSVSRAVQFLKGKSSHRLLSEYPKLRKRYWGQHLWARGYWVASSGNVTDEVWKKYIEDQKPEPPDDNFKVV